MTVFRFLASCVLLATGTSLPAALPSGDQSVPVWGRLQLTWPEELGVERCEFTAPDGTVSSRPGFRYRPVRFSYDSSGYEQARLEGEAVIAARFTPDRPGGWTWRAFRGTEAVARGRFAAVETPGVPAGYIGISPHDSRYFSSSTGSAYVPVGMNLCWPQSFALPAGGEFAESDRRGVLGRAEYARWFARLAEQGGNFARLWLSTAYFSPDTQIAGEVDDIALARIDGVIEEARKHGIRLKLCLDHFRAVRPVKGVPPAFVRTIRHPVDGREPADMEEWFSSPEWRALWLKKADALIARHGDDPIVFAWELWNEINCCGSARWPTIRDWTRDMLGEFKRRSPRNLVTNSLGSFDAEENIGLQNDFHMKEMDFQQVHRYLDQGAPLAICRTDPIMAGVDAIRRARRPNRPVLLAETGAVNDNHTGPFRYYRWDDEGLLFHDVTYPAFFAGAAGSGQTWHWDGYVDQKNLWSGLGALSAVLKGVEVDREDFVPMDLSTDTARVLVLNGRHWLLGWVRNTSDTWENRLARQLPPETVSGLVVNLSSCGPLQPAVELFRPWPEDATGQGRVNGTELELPPFAHGLVFRIRKPDPDR